MSKKIILILAVLFFVLASGDRVKTALGNTSTFTGFLTVIANLAPNRPILNIPAPNTTSALTSIVFEMTATDPDADNLKYKNVIYQNEACTQVVETHDQTFSQTGWTGQNASASAEYTSGN